MRRRIGSAGSGPRLRLPLAVHGIRLKFA